MSFSADKVKIALSTAEAGKTMLLNLLIPAARIPAVGDADIVEKMIPIAITGLGIKEEN